MGRDVLDAENLFAPLVSMHIINTPHISNLRSVRPKEPKEAYKAVLCFMMGYSVALFTEFVVEHLANFLEPVSWSCQDKALALSLVTLNCSDMGFSYISHINCSHLYPWAPTRQLVIHKHADNFTGRKITWDKGGSNNKSRVNDRQFDSFIFRLSCDKVPRRPFS